MLILKNRITVLIIGLTVSVAFTLFTYFSIKKAIQKNENLITTRITESIGSEFKWRYNQRHTAVTMGFFYSNITMSDYNKITFPLLDNSVQTETSIGWCPRVKYEDRDKFIEKANEQYEGHLHYDIKMSSEHGFLKTRDDKETEMFPLLYSNPLSLTYIGLDFNAPVGVFENIPQEGRPIQVSNKLILSQFGGFSRYVDENYEPIGNFKEQNPVIFVVFHPVFDNGNGSELSGVIGVTFEPRVFINRVAESFSETMTGMGLYVFRKKTFESNNFELIFDLETSEEGNPDTLLNIDNVKQGKYYSKSFQEEGVDIVVVVTSKTKPSYVSYLTVFFIGIISTSFIWYINIGLQKSSNENLKLSRAKSKFIAEMSHELRTPLNGILGTSYLLLSEKLSTSGIECVSDLNKCCTLLRGIICEVLDFSKIEQNYFQIDIQKINIRETLVSTMRIMANSKRTYVEQRGSIELSLLVHELVPRFIHSDVEKINKIVMNFIEHSFKFTIAGSVNVSIFMEKNSSKNKKSSKIGPIKLQQQNFLKIVVKDTGKGFSKETIDNIFQSHEHVQIGRCTGLSMVISKSFVESMGGHIECKSVISEGTTFTIFIKVNTIVSEPKYLFGNFEDNWIIESDKHDKIETSANASVLLVDDMYINLRIMAKTLKNMGITYHVASSGERASELCLLHKYDLILIDYCMGGISGVQAAEKIQKSVLNSLTRIILVTASEYDDNIRNSGLDYMQKPLSTESIKNLFTK